MKLPLDAAFDTKFDAEDDQGLPTPRSNIEPTPKSKKNLHTDKKRQTRVRSSVPTFLLKLFEICTVNKHQTTICWSEDGQSLEILDREEFKTNLLPTYFKHNNVNSFVR